MFKYKELITSLLFLSCIFIMISSVSAANYYVNNDTTHKNITNWMENDANSGDKLIFNTTTYELSDTIFINKSITIMSYKNTQINFNKGFDMFKIYSNAVNFSGMTLNHAGNYIYNDDEEHDIFSVIGGTSKNINFNIKKTNIYCMNGVGISLHKIIGNITDCNFTTESKQAIISVNWTGNIINTKIRSKAGIGGSYDDEGLVWKGNIINCNFITEFSPVTCDYWKGKILGNKMYSYGVGQYAEYPGVSLGYSQGTIKNCTIKSESTSSVYARKSVKIINSKLTPKKKHPKVRWYLPDLTLYLEDKKNNNYYFNIINEGYENSKANFLVIKYYKKIIKKIYIKPLKARSSTIIKTTIPKKHNKKDKKTAEIDFYNQIKENKKNNKCKF